jgi:small subunit ribosomal protein S17
MTEDKINQTETAAEEPVVEKAPAAEKKPRAPRKKKEEAPAGDVGVIVEKAIDDEQAPAAAEAETAEEKPKPKPRAKPKPKDDEDAEAAEVEEAAVEEVPAVTEAPVETAEVTGAAAVTEAAAEKPEAAEAVKAAEDAVGRRNARKTRIGVVVSDKMDKTIVVAIETRVKHALYKKIVKRTYKLKAHDQTNECRVGDRVKIMETRPLSKEKRWRLVEIIEKAK